MVHIKVIGIGNLTPLGVRGRFEELCSIAADAIEKVSNRLFQDRDIYWCSLSSGDLWNTSRQLKKRLCFPSKLSSSAEICGDGRGS